LVCEDKGGEEETVRGFLLSLQATLGDSVFGFHLVKYLWGSVGQPWEEDCSLELLWGSQRLGMYGPKTILVVILNCVSVVCTLAYRASGLRIFSGASFGPMQGMGRGWRFSCLIDWYVMYVESELSLVVKVLDVRYCVCMCLCSVRIESLLKLSNLFRWLIVMFVVLVEHKGCANYCNY
jgi:hypothetical protein